MATLTKDNESYSGGRYTATNGVWNQGSLVNGVGYTQTIQLNEATFPNGVTMSWAWPEEGNGSVYAYPEIGWSVAGGAVQISDLLSLDATYDFRISGDPTSHNIAFEAWLYPDARGIWETSTSEVMLWVHSNGWKPDFESSFADAHYSAGLEIDPNWGDLSGGTSRQWQYVAALPSADKLSGTISYSNLLKDLIWKGVLTGHEYITTVELGAETMGGKGSLHVAALNYVEQRKALVSGTTGDDLFTAKAVGQNHVAGGAGTDTVAYAGRFADHEVQSRAGDVLVRGKGDLTTLDMLESVEKVRFADGVYDWASRSFTASDSAPVSAVTVTGQAIDGSPGADRLTGSERGDFIRGLDGNDQIDGGAGDDDVNGNAGADFVRGGAGADWVRGGKDNDTVDGGPGDDPHVNGNLGDDVVRGGEGADRVYGGQGDDQLFGDGGDDLLSGDVGNDILTGGAGADRFAFARGGGQDWITDFNWGVGDRVLLAPGTVYSLVVQDGQAVIDLGGGDRIGLAGVAPTSLGDWLAFG